MTPSLAFISRVASAVMASAFSCRASIGPLIEASSTSITVTIAHSVTLMGE